MKKQAVRKREFSSTKPLGFIHEFYISGSLESAENYIEVFDIIRHASENDVVKLYINSYGGDLMCAIQFMRVLGETEAQVVCSIEGACYSAATMLFLCADSFEITPHSSFMVHNYAGGSMGKGGEMHSQIIHERKWSDKLLHEVYEGFLEESEIQDLLNNRDIWMEVDEVVERMNKKIKKMQELAELEEATKPA